MTTDSIPDFQYDGFLSYSTVSDYQTARRVESFLESFHKLTPPAGTVIRRLQVCRDGSDFRLPKLAKRSPDHDPIWEIIVTQLEKARYLLVLCSPGAVASPWVAKEISWFIDHRGPDWVLPLLTVDRDPVHAPEECFPAGIIAAGIHDARIWYDLRSQSKTADRRVRDYEDEMVRLAGDLLEWDAQKFGPLATLWQREQLRTRRRRATFVTGVAGALIVLASVATWSALQARQEALRARIASLIGVAGSQKDPSTSALVLNEVASLTGDTAPFGATSLAARLVVAKRPLAILRGHHGAVVSVVFNASGDALLTASQDGTARIWRADAQGKPTVLQGSGAGLVDTKFSHDGKRIVTADAEGVGRIWTADGAAQPIVLRGHEGALRTASFSADDTRVVTTSEDGTARIWVTTNGSLLAVLRGHAAGLRSAVFSKSGDRVLTASDDGTARLWSIDGQQRMQFGYPGMMRLANAAFSPDERNIVAASSEGTGWIWSLSGEFPFVTLVSGSSALSSAMYSPDGRWIATASEVGEARLWNIENLNPFDRTTKSDLAFVAGSPLRKAVFSPDSSRVAAVAEDGSAHVWAIDGAENPFVLGYHEGPVLDLAFSPDGARIATVSSDSTIRIWEVAPASTPVVADVHRGPIAHVQLDAAADRVLTRSKDGALWLWRREGAGFVQVYHGETPVLSASLNARGSHIAIVGKDELVTVMDANMLHPLPEFANSISTARFASVNSDATAIVTIVGQNLVQLWRRSGKEAALTFSGHEGLVNSARFSADGQRIVTAGQDKTVRIWKTDGTGEPLIFRGHQSAVTDASFSPDGRFVVSASGDATARVWDLTVKLPPRILGGHTGPVFSAAFSGDGSRVVTGSSNEARVWRIDAPDLPVILNVPAGKVSAVAFNHEGTEAATATDDGRLWLWHVDWHWLTDQLRRGTHACLSGDQRFRLLGAPPTSTESSYRNCVLALDRR